MTLLQTLMAGLVGTACMSTVMTLIHRSEWASADMIRALGSLVTRKYETALLPGVLIHFAAGMALSIPYAIVLGRFGDGPLLMHVGLGGLLGFVHGLVMSLILVALASERHPVKQFQEAGVEVAVAHIAGHVVYGMGVALVVHVLGINWGA